MASQAKARIISAPTTQKELNFSDAHEASRFVIKWGYALSLIILCGLMFVGGVVMWILGVPMY